MVFPFLWKNTEILRWWAMIFLFYFIHVFVTSSFLGSSLWQQITITWNKRHSTLTFYLSSWNLAYLEIILFAVNFQKVKNTQDTGHLSIQICKTLHSSSQKHSPVISKFLYLPIAAGPLDIFNAFWRLFFPTSYSNIN